MKRRLTFAICILMLTLVSLGQRPFPFGGRAYPIIPYPVIPYPNKLAEETGTFKFKSSLTVTMPPEFRSELPLFTRTFADEYFTRIVPSPNGKLVFKRNAALENEEYRLTVTSEKMEVEAAGTTGCFWAIQTIRHLMILTGEGTYTVANCQIEDKPRLIWRGFMLDESRHFYGKKVVRELLDQMALIKMNVFHWHLTDDHGWRIQIKKYPLLTEVGAWRDDDIWSGDTSAVGGFYTQEEIKEIIEYAAQRHITVVPEIEMPGHCVAAVLAYPWLGFSEYHKPSADKYGALNVASERVYKFIEDVLTEVMDLFPSEVIHIGGDEVVFRIWKNMPELAAFIKEKGLGNYSDLQMYFTNRVSHFLENHGRRMMGWNEIMGDIHLYGDGEGDATMQLAKNAISQFYAGDPKLMKEAILKGYDVVNSDSPYTYLDYTYSRIPLEKAYSFSPVPEDLNPEQEKHVLGIETPMWTEYFSTVDGIYQQIFPRIAAIAEVGWTNEESKNFDRFNTALEKLKRYWDRNGITYFIPGMHKDAGR